MGSIGINKEVHQRKGKLLRFFVPCSVHGNYAWLLLLKHKLVMSEMGEVGGVGMQWMGMSGNFMHQNITPVLSLF